MGHGNEKCLCGVGADDSPSNPASIRYQIRNPADVVDVGMGQKEIIELCRRHGKAGELDGWVISL